MKIPTVAGVIWKIYLFGTGGQTHISSPDFPFSLRGQAVDDGRLKLSTSRMKDLVINSFLQKPDTPEAFFFAAWTVHTVGLYIFYTVGINLVWVKSYGGVVLITVIAIPIILNVYKITIGMLYNWILSQS